MKRKLPVIALVAAILVGLGVWWFSPEQILKRRVGDLLDTATVPATMSEVGRGARGPKVAAFFADSLRIEAPEPVDRRLGSTVANDRIAANYSAAARRCREITFTDLSFGAITIGETEASVRFRVDGLVDLGGRRPVDGILEVDSRWIRENDDWLLKEVRWTESPRQMP